MSTVIKEQKIYNNQNRFKKVLKSILVVFLCISVFLVVTSLVISKVYKSEIKSFVITQVEELIKADIDVDKIELSLFEKFPKVSLSFSNFDVVSSYYKKKDTLLIGRKLFFEFDMIDVLQHNYQINSLAFEDAFINFKINQQGVSNFDIFKTKLKSDSSSSILLSLDNVQFKNIDIVYKDDKQGVFFNTTLKEAKFKGDFNKLDLDVKVYNDFYIHNLTFNDFVLEEKNLVFDGVFHLDKINKVLSLSDNSLSISDFNFLVNGEVDYSYEDKFNLNISCTTSNVNISSVEMIDKEFYDEYLKLYKLNGTVDLDATIVGFMSRSEFPTLNLGFNVYDAGFQLLELPFNDVGIKGILQLDENINQLKVLSSSLSLYDDDIVLNGVYSFKDENNVKFNLQSGLSKFSSSEILKLLSTDSLNMTFNGNTDLDIQGVVDFEADKIFLKSLIGYVQTRDGILNIGSNNRLELEKIQVDFNQNGSLHFNLTSLYNNENCSANVLVQNFKDYFNGKSSFIYSKGKIFLDKFLIPVNDNSSSKHDGLIIPDFLNADVDLKINEVLFSSVTLSNFKLQGKISPNNINISDYRFNIFDGLVVGNAKVNQSNVFVHTDISDVDFQTLFKAFDNFDQQNITSEHITGVCDLVFDTKMPFNSSDMKSEVIVVGDFKIKNGQLLQVPIIDDIVRYLDKNMITKSVLDMKHLKAVSKEIYFDEIKNTFLIKNGGLLIPDFTIKSSVLDVNLEGEQKLSGYFNYKMNFRLAEIVGDSQDDDNEFGVVEDDGTGMRVFMKIFGTPDSVTFEMDKKTKKSYSKNNNKTEKKILSDIIKSELPFLNKSKKKNDADKDGVINRSSSEKVEFQFEEERDEVIIKEEKISNDAEFQFEIEE